MPEGPLILLSGAPGRTFIETGLVVIRDTHSRLFSKRSLKTERDLLNNITIHHEWVHYVQSITCASVHHAAQQMLRLAVEVVGSAKEGSVPQETHRKFAELTELLYGRRANESLEIIDRPGFIILSPIPDSHQIGMLDLLEGVAVLESFKLCTQNAGVHEFLAFRDHYIAGTDRNVYRWSFDWLAHAIGPEAAYELLAPVSFLALQTNDPSSEFVQLTRRLSATVNLDDRGLSDVEALAERVYGGNWSPWLRSFEHGEPQAGHVTLDPCAVFAVSQLGVREVTQLGATPSRVTSESFEALRPPVTAYSGADSLSLAIPSYARNGLAAAVIDWTAVVGAAERLTLRADSDVYQFCPHRAGCPHFESALCHRHFAPPGTARHHDECRFPATIRQLAGLKPHELWAKVGRERKSVPELVAEFKATGEAGLWALARRQRASIIAWLGTDGYEELVWKCKATAEKTLHALQTQKMDDLVEARMFRNAVVNEVCRLAHENSEGAQDREETPSSG